MQRFQVARGQLLEVLDWAKPAQEELYSPVERLQQDINRLLSRDIS